MSLYEQPLRKWWHISGVTQIKIVLGFLFIIMLITNPFIIYFITNYKGI